MNMRFIGKIFLVVVAVNAVAWALSFPTKDARRMVIIAPPTTPDIIQGDQTAASAQSVLGATTSSSENISSTTEQ